MSSGAVHPAPPNLRLAFLDVMLYLVGVREVGGENRGASVGAFQSAAGIKPGDPWCAAAVNFAAERGAARLGLRSPMENVPLQGYVQSYVDTLPRMDPKDVLPGDLFALWSAKLGRYAHIGAVEWMDAARGTFGTVEGNTDAAGTREGDEVLRRERSLVGPTKDRPPVFLRWTRKVEPARP